MKTFWKKNRLEKLYFVSKFNDFLRNDKSVGILLILCTIVSLYITNSSLGEGYHNFWNKEVLAHHSLGQWVNDGLMAIFFFVIGMELRVELSEGELSNRKTAILPFIGALGGVIVPALLYMIINYGTDTMSGAGIPMATDIAFALGVLSLLGNRISIPLKVFLTALAVIDDLGAILVIAVFYTSSISYLYLASALGVLVLLWIINKYLRVKYTIVYILGGLIVWYCMFRSGIHATIAGVLLAFVLPYEKEDPKSVLFKMLSAIHMPVQYIVLPLFALANTAILIDFTSMDFLTQNYSKGIFLGLVVGKPLGIILFLVVGWLLGITQLPSGVKWKEMVGISCLGGIGFTMSIFISMLAFDPVIHAEYINDAKLVILISSLVASIVGYFWLLTVSKSKTTIVKKD